jgi:hypothetical protein
MLEKIKSLAKFNQLHETPEEIELGTHPDNRGLQIGANVEDSFEIMLLSIRTLRRPTASWYCFLSRSESPGTTNGNNGKAAPRHSEGKRIGEDAKDLEQGGRVL